MYFIGVTTAHSSINAIFPRWAARLRLGDGVLRGWDFRLNDEPRRYRAAVEFIKRDPQSLGALVTSHKVDVFTACHDLFGEIEPLSRTLGEISSIYKRAGRLQARSVDPWTVGLALDAFVAREHWTSGTEALVFGAGGSGAALVWQLVEARPPGLRPRQVHAADTSRARLAHLRELHASWPDAAALECHEITDTTAADALLRRLPPGSLVVNATGLGKDAPGSPVSDAAVFPERGLVWDFNYRGDLRFLAQARAQAGAYGLHVEDGWVYFLHGWLQVMADIFNQKIPTEGPLFDELAAIASDSRRPK